MPQFRLRVRELEENIFPTHGVQQARIQLTCVKEFLQTIHNEFCIPRLRCLVPGPAKIIEIKWRKNED